MAYTIATGRPGFDGIFTVNGVTLNDTATLPHVKLGRIGGYYEGPDSDDPRSKKTGRIGETIGPTTQSGKTLVFPGVVRAGSLAELHEYRSTLLAALAPQSAEAFFTVDPPPAAGGGPQWGFNARILAPSPSIPEEQTRGPNARPSPWQRDFTLTVRMSDPRFYVLDSSIDEETTDVATGVTVTNEGTAPSDPVVQLAGVVADTPCSVWSGGKRLDFESPSHSGTLLINFLSRTATISGNDQSGRLDVLTSTWWDPGVMGLEPGVAETVKASGCTAVRVQAFHAAW